MADPSASVSSPPFLPGAIPSFDAEMKDRARGLAKVLDIPASTFQGRELPAYHVMSHLAAMPTRKEFGQRHAYGNEVLSNLDRLMPISQPENRAFLGAVSTDVIMMQEFPAWFANFSKSDEELVSDYILIDNILYGMKLIGWGGGATAVTSASAKAVGGAAKVFESGVGRTAAAQLGQAMTRGAIAGAKGVMTGGLVTTGGIAIWVVGQVAATELQREQEKIKAEITRRYQERRLSADLYRKAVGSSAPLPERYFYDIR